MYLFASTLEFLGMLCIAIAALSVHHRFLNEHRVDKKVFRAMKLEQAVGFFGIFLISVGFVAHILEKVL